MDVRERLQRRVSDLHERYMLDRQELGKVMIVVSVALLLVSSHAILTIDRSVEEMQEFRQDYDRLSSIVMSDNFNESMDTVQSIRSATVQVRVATALAAFRQTQESVGGFNGAVESLEETRERYQWIVLLSVLGVVAGVTTLYI